ncbi:hypothetical protein SBOR_7464 [Sclerotinia borealis F-4128]|uniref:Tyr recombinase domain-containing protein n=1 Tax=Sclerotinia borealis (strain F-4128) TaxID=1432307 RepID=W9C5W1_SCLBF|nr:hypothetical protein SBOR_7464 [Sclerotinia borealis F-4128]
MIIYSLFYNENPDLFLHKVRSRDKSNNGNDREKDKKRKRSDSVCRRIGHEPRPATQQVTGAWLAARGDGSTTMPKVDASSMASMLSALRSMHVDRLLPLHVFQNNNWVSRLIAGIKALQPHMEKTQALPLTANLLHKAIGVPHCEQGTDNLNLSVALIVSEQTLVIHTRNFINTKLTRRHISFASNEQYAILHVKRSKTDTEFKGVDICLAATNDGICPVSALHSMRSRLIEAFIPDGEKFTGHSLRRGAAQTASDLGIGSEDIKALGRWTSQWLRLYFTTNASQRLALSQRFLTGVPPHS